MSLSSIKQMIKTLILLFSLLEVSSQFERRRDLTRRPLNSKPRLFFPAQKTGIKSIGSRMRRRRQRQLINDRCKEDFKYQMKRNEDCDTDHRNCKFNMGNKICCRWRYNECLKSLPQLPETDRNANLDRLIPLNKKPKGVTKLNEALKEFVDVWSDHWQSDLLCEYEVDTGCIPSKFDGKSLGLSLI